MGVYTTRADKVVTSISLVLIVSSMILLLSPSGFGIIPSPPHATVYRTMVYWTSEKTTIQLANIGDADVEIIKLTLQAGSKSSDVTAYVSGTTIKAKTGMNLVELRWPNSFDAIWTPGQQYIFKFELQGGAELSFTEIAPANGQNPPNYNETVEVELVEENWGTDYVDLILTNKGSVTGNITSVTFKTGDGWQVITQYTRPACDLPVNLPPDTSVTLHIFNFNYAYDTEYIFTLHIGDGTITKTVTINSPQIPELNVEFSTRTGGVDVSLSCALEVIVTQVRVADQNFAMNENVSQQPKTIPLNFSVLLGRMYNFTFTYHRGESEWTTSKTYTTESPLGVLTWAKYTWDDGTTSLVVAFSVGESVTVEKVCLGWGSGIGVDITANCSPLEFLYGTPYTDFYVNFPNRAAENVFDHTSYWLIFELTDGRKIWVEVGD